MEEVIREVETPIAGVQPGEIGRLWPRLKPMVERAATIEEGFLPIDVLRQAKYGNWQLWVIGDFQAVAATEIQLQPRRKVLWVWFVAGDRMSEWLDDWVAVQEAFARAHDCQAIEAFYRPGWRKLEERFPDYKPVRTMYRRTL